MSTSSSKKKQKLTTVSGNSVDVGVTADHAVVEALQEIPLVVETEWFNLKGFKVKAVQVAPSVYQAARSHLRALMRKNAPTPPTQKGADGKLKPNPFHPEYKKEMEAWELLYQDIDDDLFFSVAILAGLQIHPESLPIPPQESWMSLVENQLGAIGINLKNTSETMIYSGDPDTFELLIFKKYILLGDPTLFKSFMEFQKASDIADIPPELMPRFSADMFLGEEE